MEGPPNTKPLVGFLWKCSFSVSGFPQHIFSADVNIHRSANNIPQLQIVRRQISIIWTTDT